MGVTSLPTKNSDSLSSTPPLIAVEASRAAIIGDNIARMVQQVLVALSREKSGRALVSHRSQRPLTSRVFQILLLYRIDRAHKRILQLRWGALRNHLRAGSTENARGSCLFNRSAPGYPFERKERWPIGDCPASPHRNRIFTIIPERDRTISIRNGSLSPEQRARALASVLSSVSVVRVD